MRLFPAEEGDIRLLYIQPKLFYSNIILPLPTSNIMPYNASYRSVIDIKDIPAIIKAARIKCGYTQQELGEKLEYARKSAEVTVARWESGTRPVPLEKIRPLATALNLTVDNLVP